mgnify:FL=1
MIYKEKNIRENQVFSADVCVIGAGPAGITTAISLAREGVSVVLLPGGRGWSKRSQDLYKGTSNKKNPLEASRLRLYGGTSKVWGGRCIPFDEIDFKERPYVKNSGWPFTKRELDPYYAKSQEYLDIGRNYDFTVKSSLNSNDLNILSGIL